MYIKIPCMTERKENRRGSKVCIIKRAVLNDSGKRAELPFDTTAKYQNTQIPLYQNDS